MTDFFIIQYSDSAKETGLIATCQSEYYAELIKHLLNDWKDDHEYDHYSYKIETSLNNMFDHRNNLKSLNE